MLVLAVKIQYSQQEICTAALCCMQAKWEKNAWIALVEQSLQL